MDTVTRVQIPAYTDWWAKGDRYGNVVKVTKGSVSMGESLKAEIAHVLLDKSNKVVRVLLADCEVI